MENQTKDQNDILLDNEKGDFIESEEKNIISSEDQEKNQLEEKDYNKDNNKLDNTPQNKFKKCLFIELNPGFSYFNLYSYYLVQFGYVMAFTFIDACQDYLLESKDYDYKIDHSETGSINGNILLFDTLYLVNNYIKSYKIFSFIISCLI